MILEETPDFILQFEVALTLLLQKSGSLLMWYIESGIKKLRNLGPFFGGHRGTDCIPNKAELLSGTGITVYS